MLLKSFLSVASTNFAKDDVIKLKAVQKLKLIHNERDVFFCVVWNAR